MGKVPVDLRKHIAANIRGCRSERYPRWGGSKRCALDFGVSPQQWSQWERGTHMPDEFRMMEIARFFGVSTEYLRRNNAGVRPAACQPVENRPPLPPANIFRAVRLEGGIEIPLRVEVERVVYLSNYEVRMERLL
jgi:transcriptional regulator with XRE-family HTH domain